MRRAVRLLLSLSLLALSWPAAAVERVAEIRATPPAGVLAPSALTSRPTLFGPASAAGVLPGENGALGAAALSSIPALPASAALPAAPASPASPAASPVPASSARPDAAPAREAASAPAERPGSVSPESADHQHVPEHVDGSAAPEAIAGAARDAREAVDGRAALPQAAAAAAAQAQDGARLFDGARASKAAAVAAPIAALGGAALLPLAGHLPHLSLAAVQAAAPELGAAGYHFATALSVAFPLPETYAALRRGRARGFPLGRAVLGTIGGLALGLVNAVMLNKASWGVMQIFVGLGIMAPYVIGRLLERGGGPMKAYLAPEGARGLKAFGHRLRRDQALWATLGVGLTLLAASAGLYAAAAALVPPLLTAHLSAHAIADLLLWLQIGKGALFVAVFAPDAVALVHGKPTKGFSFWFTAIYLASVTAYTLWGFSAAALSPAGPIRDQYLALALRNAFETVASAVSLVAIWRAARRARKA